MSQKTVEEGGRQQESRGRGKHALLGILACFALVCGVLGCSSSKSSRISSSHLEDSSGITADADLSRKTPDELAHYIFEHHGCKNCHTLGSGGKLGFTDYGKQVGKNFEGCIRLLTAMNVIAQVKEGDRSAEEKLKAARFQEFGCTACHQITPGKMGLTQYGAKLASLHMACTDVEKLLSSRQPAP